MSIHIPGTIDEAVASLNGIGRLLTAKEWERAAIVYAFTQDGRRQRASTHVSYEQFAVLGIQGLRTRQSVAAHHDAWQQAVDDGQARGDIAPGDAVELPTIPWGEVYDTRNAPQAERNQRAFTAALRANPDVIREAVASDPELAIHVAQAVYQAPIVRTAYESRIAREEAPPDRRVSERWAPAEHDYSRDLLRAATLLRGVIDAARKQEWQPTPLEKLLIQTVNQLLSDVEGSTDDLFIRIDGYLAKASEA